MRRLPALALLPLLVSSLLACKPDEPSTDDEAEDTETETGEPLSCLDTDPAGPDIIIASDADFEGLELPECVPGKIVISGGTLTSIAALAGVTQVGALEIRYNSMLPNLAGIEQLERVGRLIIVGNPQITTLPELGALYRIDRLTVTGNGMLTSLGNYPNITTIERIELSDNPLLPALDGFAGLTTVTGDLLLTNNPAIVDFSTIGGVQTVGGNLTIEDNMGLQELMLTGMTTISGDLRIISNPTLSECRVNEFLDQVEVVGATIVSANQMDAC